MKCCFVPVDRESMRRSSYTCHFTLTHHLLAAAPLPTPPAVIQWGRKGGKEFNLPTLGNNKVGNCYLTACLHLVQCMLGQVDHEISFSEPEVIALYKQLSGGDNGLRDDQIFPAFKRGIFGHSILDDMMIRPNDHEAIKLAMFLFGPALWTAALANEWVRNPQPGFVWQPARPNPRNGHAMLLSGKADSGLYEVETWGFEPAGHVTPQALERADSEVIVCFSREWFNADGIAPNGLSYDTLAGFWQQLGGMPLPPWSKPQVSGLTITIAPDGTITIPGYEVKKIA